MSESRFSAQDSSEWTNGIETKSVSVSIGEPIKELEFENWECRLIMTGHGEINRKICGASGIQAISLALQQAKFHLLELVVEGFVLENQTKKDTLRTLNAIYGRASMLDKHHIEEICVEAIERLLEAKGTEEEQNADMDFLKRHIADPKIIDYIFHPKEELLAEEILAKALAYKPIIL